LELRSRYDLVIWVERRGDGLGKVEEVIEGLNNMCTVIGDIVSSVTRVAGYGGARCCGGKIL
jgi:hypothetical protein